jgi:hypothetical protein
MRPGDLRETCDIVVSEFRNEYNVLTVSCQRLLAFRRRGVSWSYRAMKFRAENFFSTGIDSAVPSRSDPIPEAITTSLESSA